MTSAIIVLGAAGQGKSTLINRVCGAEKTRVSNNPAEDGTTVMDLVRHGEYAFLDTQGLDTREAKPTASDAFDKLSEFTHVQIALVISKHVGRFTVWLDDFAKFLHDLVQEETGVEICVVWTGKGASEERLAYLNQCITAALEKLSIRVNIFVDSDTEYCLPSASERSKQLLSMITSPPLMTLRRPTRQGSQNGHPTAQVWEWSSQTEKSKSEASTLTTSIKARLYWGIRVESPKNNASHVGGLADFKKLLPGLVSDLKNLKENNNRNYKLLELLGDGLLKPNVHLYFARKGIPENVGIWTRYQLYFLNNRNGALEEFFKQHIQEYFPDIGGPIAKASFVEALITFVLLKVPSNQISNPTNPYTTLINELLMLGSKIVLKAEKTKC